MVIDYTITASNMIEIASIAIVTSAVTLASGVVANITSVSLAAGDYDVWGVVLYVPGGAYHNAPGSGVD